MIPVVGNLVASLAAATIDDHYDEVAWLWYGFSMVYWIPLFVMSILRVTTREPLGTLCRWLSCCASAYQPNLPDDRLMPSLFIWVAALSVACSAYLQAKSADCNCDPWLLDYYPRYTGLFLGRVKKTDHPNKSLIAHNSLQHHVLCCVGCLLRAGVHERAPLLCQTPVRDPPARWATEN